MYNRITFDQQSHDRDEILRRIADACRLVSEMFRFDLDQDGLGVHFWADSVSILKEVHQSAFPTFEFPGVVKEGQRYRTRFRLR
jgi:hypothetical protein